MINTLQCDKVINRLSQFHRQLFHVPRTLVYNICSIFLNKNFREMSREAAIPYPTTSSLDTPPVRRTLFYVRFRSIRRRFCAQRGKSNDGTAGRTSRPRVCEREIGFLSAPRSPRPFLRSSAAAVLGCSVGKYGAETARAETLSRSDLWHH